MSSPSSSSCPHSSLPADCEVVIVGGGVSGASAALHLIRAGVQNVVLIESGSPGNGSSSPTPYPDNRSFRDGDEEGKLSTAFYILL